MYVPKAINFKIPPKWLFKKLKSLNFHEIAESNELPNTHPKLNGSASNYNFISTLHLSNFCSSSPSTPQHYNSGAFSTHHHVKTSTKDRNKVLLQIPKIFLLDLNIADANFQFAHYSNCNDKEVIKRIQTEYLLPKNFILPKLCFSILIWNIW